MTAATPRRRGGRGPPRAGSACAGWSAPASALAAAARGMRAQCAGFAPVTTRKTPGRRSAAEASMPGSARGRAGSDKRHVVHPAA